MKQNTRILCGAMAAAMTVSLAGCASNAASSTTAESTAASSSVTAASATVAAAGATYTGTVTAVSANALTLTTESDGEVTVPLVDATTYTRGSMGGQAPDGNPPEMPGNSGDSGDQAGGTPPELPAGDTAGQGSGNGQQPHGNAPEGQPNDNGQGADGSAPEKPAGDGQNSGDTPQGSAPGGETEALTYESIAVGDTVTVIVGDDGNASSVELAGGPGGAPGGGSSKPESYDAATEFTADDVRDGVTYASTGTDENSIYVYDGADVTLTNAAISRDSTDSTGGDNSSFYGVGAAALVTDGTLKISDSSITTDAKGGAGVFAYGDGTAYVSDTTITTRQNTSGGIHVAGGGTLYAWDLNVDTSGESSAAIRSDRGSGTMVVDGQGRAVTIKDNNGNVLVQGTSEYTVTVEDYSTTVDAANASVSVTFSEYAVEKI